MQLIHWLSIAVSLASCGYVLFAACCVLRFAGRMRRVIATVTAPPPVTLLKPLCGLDIELLENLRSFCEQDHPVFQIIFGVRDVNDPAIGVVRQLIREFPDLDLELVIDATVHGSNLKISNLMNM